MPSWPRSTGGLPRGLTRRTSRRPRRCWRHSREVDGPLRARGGAAPRCSPKRAIFRDRRTGDSVLAEDDGVPLIFLRDGSCFWVRKTGESMEMLGIIGKRREKGLHHARTAQIRRSPVRRAGTWARQCADEDEGVTRWRVVYPDAAANVLMLLPSRLRGINQPVLSTP